jgi:DNA-binding PucR family transcriptional regulator
VTASIRVPPDRAPDEEREFLELRTQLSNLQGLLVLSMLMTESEDESQILHLAGTSVSALARCHLEGVALTEAVWRPAKSSCVRDRRGLQRQLDQLGNGSGMISLPGHAWAWAYSLRGLAGYIGHLVVGADEPPPQSSEFLLRALSQQAGVALANAQLHAQERATSSKLGKVVHALKRSMDIHQRLTTVAVSGEGQEGIARAVHELTGYPVAIEDRYGNLRAWAGSDQPDPYPKDPPERREELLRRVLAEVTPVRDGGRLIAVAQPRGDILGVLVLVDPAGTAGEHEVVALEHGATVLAMELARLRGLAESELRLRRDLVEELLAGTDEDSALARAQALGYDLERRHRVVVVEGRGLAGADDDAFFHAVRRSTRDLDVGSLLVGRGSTVVVLAHRDVDWDTLRAAVLGELGGGRCRIGTGGCCHRVGDVPRSYREAQMALKIQAGSGAPDGTISFDDLGVYRVLSRVPDTKEVEQFVRDWIGPLLEYDARRQSELVKTISAYLECGGNYDATAQALVVHRSTLKYRLQRIRDLTGYNLNDPDTHFNLQLATRAWATLEAMRG